MVGMFSWTILGRLICVDTSLNSTAELNIVADHVHYSFMDAMHPSRYVAVENVEYSGFSRKIEVECRTLSEALEAGEVGVDIIMLDNFEHEDLHSTAKQVKSMHPNVIIEASGSVTEDNITKYAGLYIDVISTSFLVQGYETIDISMKVT